MRTKRNQAHTQTQAASPGRDHKIRKTDEGRNAKKWLTDELFRTLGSSPHSSNPNDILEFGAMDREIRVVERSIRKDDATTAQKSKQESIQHQARKEPIRLPPGGGGGEAEGWDCRD